MTDNTTTSGDEKYLSSKDQARLWLLKDEVELLTSNIKRITVKREQLQQEIKRIQTQLIHD